MDMTRCHKGDMLLLRNGESATYVTFDNHGNLLYPHIINHKGRSRTVTNGGLEVCSEWNSQDVVDFYTEKSKPDGLKGLSDMNNELLDENTPTKENGISIKESISTIAEMLVLQSRIVKRQTDILSGHYKSKDIKIDNIPITAEEKLNREFKVIERHIEHMQALREEII